MKVGAFTGGLGPQELKETIITLLAKLRKVRTKTTNNLIDIKPSDVLSAFFPESLRDVFSELLSANLDRDTTMSQTKREVLGRAEEFVPFLRSFLLMMGTSQQAGALDKMEKMIDEQRVELGIMTSAASHCAALVQRTRTTCCACSPWSATRRWRVWRYWRRSNALLSTFLGLFLGRRTRIALTTTSSSRATVKARTASVCTSRWSRATSTRDMEGCCTPTFIFPAGWCVLQRFSA